MKNVAPKLPPSQYEQNFAELHPPFTANAAVADANRCLYCFDSPCTKACPTHIDIPTFIKKIASGNLQGSAKTILSSNWVALTCAKACPVDVLCEGACVYNERGEEPIQIGRLQRFAMDRYFEAGAPPLFHPLPRNGKSVGIIGAGPAGLACAAELSLMGYEAVVYEGKKKPGGLDTWGIAPYKMRQADSMKEVGLVEKLGVSIRTGVTIGKDMTVDELLQRHDAMFIGTGLPRAVRLGIRGEATEGVYEALEFIQRVTTRSWKSVDVGTRVAVIGAGNTAIDAATEAKRLGANDVSIIYRRSEKDMSAYDFEYALAKTDGVRFFFNVIPKRIVGKKHVKGIECERVVAQTSRTGGRQTLRKIPGSTFTIPVDMVIVSIGQEIAKELVLKIPGVKMKNGKVAVDPETYQTTNAKVFAGGDCINGGKEVVNAAYDGKRAAHGIDKYLSKKSIA